MTTKDFEKVLGTWSNSLPDTTLQLGYDIYLRINDLRKSYTIYPEQKDIFKVFNTPLDSIKVVILGQDPYYNGNVTGVAFACKTNPSPSFKQIWNCIKNTTEKECKEEIGFHLNHLVNQNVFLLNTILTVQESQPLSHKYLNWEQFTSSVINEINNKKKNIVFMLWGIAAQRYKKYIDTDKHLLLMATHPQYATYQDKQWECNHFVECNEYLKTHNIKPIQWR